LVFHDHSYLKRGLIYKFIKNHEYMASLFDEADVAEQANEIGEAILAARSLHLTDIAVRWKAKVLRERIQRFLKRADPRLALWPLFREDEEFVIGGPTEIEHPQT
jgi:hypothetical protein